MSQQQQSNYSNVPRMHHEVKETFIESPRFAEAITLPRQPDMAYSNGGYSNNSSSQQARTVNEGFIPEPVMQQGITIPRPMHKKPIPSPYENRHVYEKPAPSAFVQLPAKDLSRQDDLEKATKRQNAGKSIMMFVDSNRKNCMYGCIPVDKKKRMICLGITGGLLILLVILGILFFPRMPDFEVLDIKVPPGNSFTLTPVNLASDDLDFKFTLQMTMNINVINPNRYQMKIETLKVSAFIMANASELNSRVPSSAELLFGRVVSNRLKVDGSNNKQLIGRGNRNTPLVFLPGKAMVFSLDFLVSYSPNKQFGNAVNDPALNEIIQLCVEAPLIPGYNRTTTIRYEAEADIGALRWLPVKPLLSGELKINCPFQGAARQALLDAIKGGSSTGVNTQVPTTQARNSRMTANSTLIKSEAVLTKEMFMGRN